jgi:hypothetical protein
VWLAVKSVANKFLATTVQSLTKKTESMTYAQSSAKNFWRD